MPPRIKLRNLDVRSVIASYKLLSKYSSAIKLKPPKLSPLNSGALDQARIQMAKVGRNDPCPCGSGKKYKKCHPGEYDNDAVLSRELASWELTACCINDDYQEMGLATIIVIRENESGDKFSFAAFLCDIFCLGLKDVHFEVNVPEHRVETFLLSKTTMQSFVPIDYVNAKSLIMGSIQYAQELGFEPTPAYARSKVMLEPGDICIAQTFTYGRNGKPFYCTGPNDNYRKIFTTLEKSCGKGNFDYFIDERAHFNYNG